MVWLLMNASVLDMSLPFLPSIPLPRLAYLNLSYVRWLQSALIRVYFPTLFAILFIIAGDHNGNICTCA